MLREQLPKTKTQAVVLPEQKAKPSRQGVVILTLLFSDILLAVLIWTVAYVLQSFDVFGRGAFSSVAAFSVIPNVAAWVGLCALLSLYPGYGLPRTEKLRRQTYAVVATLAITAIFATFLQVGDLLSRLVLLSGFLGLLLLGPLNRYFAEWAMMKIGLWGKPVVVLGSVERTVRLIGILRQEWALGFRPVAFFDDKWAPKEGRLEGVPYGGTLADAINLAALKRGVDTAILLAMPYGGSEHLGKLVNQLSVSLKSVIIVPEIAEVTTSAVVARDLMGTFGVEAKQNLLNPWARRAKRVFDLFGVVIGGLLISPLLLVIGVLIKLDSPGPVFYKQERPGVGGKHFCFWKFRTMRAEAGQLLTDLLQSNPDVLVEWKRDHKLRDDPRVTRIGRFLRKTSLDELPQLWNVLHGEMSLVGPRPMLVEEIPKYGEVYELYKRMSPGITGLWQVSGRSDTSYEERVAMVAYYVRNWSIWLDLIILARTVKDVIAGEGAI